jgi:hypothetical protein
LLRGLEFMTFLLQPPKNWDYRHGHRDWLGFFFPFFGGTGV